MAQMAVADLGFMIEPEFVVEPYLKTGELVERLPDYRWFGLNLYAVFHLAGVQHVAQRLLSVV